MENVYKGIAEALMEKRRDSVVSLTKKALDQGLSPDKILEKEPLCGMAVVGRRFTAAEMFIPEVLHCASAMHNAMAILNPLLSESEATGKGKVLLGTIEA